VRNNPPLQHGLNTHHGKLTYAAVAEAFGLVYTEALKALG
jgi:alanine dehydrogenase